MKTDSRARAMVTVTLGLAAPLLLVLAAGMSHGAKQPSGADPGETAGKSKQFKNIKVLKNLPANQLIPTMRTWNASLGVKCDFCHTINADHSGFDRDDKPPKNAARAMVTMANDLNKHQKALGGRVTCYLCHHGRPEPEFRPGTEPSPQR